jgi:hypothetical protein
LIPDVLSAEDYPRAKRRRQEYECALGRNKESYNDARKYGHEVLGWLVGFFKDNEVYVLRSEKCTKYLRQSRIEAEAHPSQESEIASSYPRDIGIVGLYHSHPFRKDYRSPRFKDMCEETMFHSDVDGITLKSRAKRRKNYLSVVTDGKNVSFFVLDKSSKKVMNLKPQMPDKIDYGKFLSSYRARIDFVFERDLSAGNASDVLKELEGYLIDYIYKNVEESEVDYRRTGENKFNLRLFAFEEDVAGENIIRMEKVGDSYNVHLRLSTSPEVFVTDREDVLRAMRDEIADNTLYLIRKSFSQEYLKRGMPKLLEFYLGDFKVNRKEFPMKSYIPPKRRMIIRKT